MKRGHSIAAPKSEDNEDDLVGCNTCGRTFAEDRIEVHEHAWRLAANNKRKPFDMTKKRTEGIDAELCAPPKGKRGIAGKGSKLVSASKPVRYCVQQR